MINNTGTLLLQTFLYLLNTGPLVNQNISVTLLENSITDPLFESKIFFYLFCLFPNHLNYVKVY